MRQTKTKTKITFARRVRTTIRLPRSRVVWCPECKGQVLMLSTDEAAALTQTTARAIFRRIEAGQLHFLEAASGALLVCRASLSVVQPNQEKEYELH